MKRIIFLVYIILCAKTAYALTISGRVLDADNKKPINGMAIGIEELDLITESGNDGSFSFEDIREGKYTLYFSHKDYGTYSEKIRAKYDFFIEKKISAKIYNTGNKNIQYKGKENNSIKQNITRDDIKNYPMRGYGDALHLMQTLPGVGSGFSLATVPVIRGTNPLYNKYYIDDIPIDFPFHYLAALLPFYSAINEESIDEAEVVKGAPQAWTSDNLGNTINIKTRSVEQDGAHGKVILDPILPLVPLFSASVVPFKDLSMSVNIRRSDIDWIIDTQKSDLYFQDYFYKITYNLFTRHRITLIGHGSKDRVNYEDYETGSGYSVTGLKWEYLINKYLFLKTVLSEYKMEQYLQNKKIYSGMAGAYLKFNPVQDRLFQILDFSYNNLYLKTGYEYIKHKNGCEGNVTLSDTIGIDFLEQTSISATRQFPVHGNSLSVFAQGGFKHRAGWIDLGVRDEKYGPTGRKSDSYALDCGLNATKDASIYLKHSINYAHPDIYYYLGDQDPDFKDAKATNWAIGSNVKMLNFFNLNCELYYSKFDNLNQGISYGVNDEFFKKASQLHIFSKEYSGKTYGGELFLKWSRNILSGWLSYAYSVSKRENDDESDFYSDFDQTHILRFVISAMLKRWTYSTILHLYSSMPYTPITGANNIAGDYSPVYGEKNSERFGMHSRLDFKIAYQIDNTRIYLEFWNVFFKSNNGIFEYYDKDKRYSSDNPKRINDLPAFIWLGIELCI